MSQRGFQFDVIANAASFFAEALNQNQATPMNNVPIGPAAGGPGRRSLIRAISCITDENFGPEFNFFNSASGFTTDPDTDGFLGRFGFTSAMGERIGGSGLYRYYIDGLAIPYYDIDTSTGSIGAQPQLLHVILQNISVTAKLIRGAASGRCHATFWLEPETAW